MAINYSGRRAGLSILVACLHVAGCGGGSNSPSTVIDPGQSLPTHAAATIKLTEANTPNLVATGYAMVHSFEYWAGLVIYEIEVVTPLKPKHSYFCGDGGQMDSVYKDLDGNAKESVGDQVVISGQGCSVHPMGGGTTTITVLAVDQFGISDVRVQVDGTLDETSLSVYGWDQRLSGTFRLTQWKDDQVMFRSEGDVTLRLKNGESLRLSNIAIAYAPPLRPDGGGIEGQLDMEFNTRLGNGGRLQLDTAGLIRNGGSNMGPRPGALMFTGEGGTRAKLSSFYEIGVGGRFKTQLDSAGKGAFDSESTVSDVEFYRALRP